MLAEVHRISSTILNAAPPSFKVMFNQNPSPATNTNQFLLTDVEDNPVDNLVFISGTGLQEISITLENATFHEAQISQDPGPIVWIVAPDGGVPTPTLDGNTISFHVLPPEQSLHPWVFRINVDTPDVKGIRSQSIFLAKPVGEQPEDLFLNYDAGTGLFSLSDSSDSSSPSGILLAGDELVLVNVKPSGRDFSVQLLTENTDSTISSISFAEPPIVWSSPDAPGWVNISGTASNAFTLSINPPTATQLAAGQSVGIRFALEITAVNGTTSTTTTVLSPDPILINATIGDG